MNDLLLGIPNVACYMDDCLIFGSDIASHNKTLETVLSRLMENGVRLNLGKSVFAQPEVEFIGHIWSRDGVAPHPEKLKAIREMPKPSTCEELRSFLGLAAYIGSRTVPHFSAKASPLWELGSSGPIVWDEKLNRDFYELKSSILSSQRLQYFNPSEPVVVQVDASGQGLGGVILQDGKPVIFVSRKLTVTEQRYSQIEREFLSIVFTLTRLRTYLFGLSFIVQTDHKPLLSIINKPIDKVSNRLQRWILNIQHFDFTLEHIAGKSNLIADGLSRNPILTSTASSEENNEYTVCFLLKCSPIDLKRVANETSRDETLQSVIAAVRDGWHSPQTCKHLKPYYSFRDELSLKLCNSSQPDSIVLLKGDLVVIPEVLITEMLDLLHEGHLGTTKMKQLIRSCCYWPGSSKSIDEYVRRCQSCTIHQRKSDIPALTPIADTLKAPYEQVAIDLTGPSTITRGKVLLTIIDYYSRFPEAYVLNSGNAHEILVKLRQTFARYGIPKSMVSDNGSVFKSKEMSDFVKQLGIRHIFTSNYHPQSNGAVERLHSTLKSRLARIIESGYEWNAALDKVLFDMRSTANAMTGQTPFQMFFGRPMRTKLSALSDCPREVSCPSRDVMGEYRNKLCGRKVKFDVGDDVFFRKEDRTLFQYPGRVTKACGNNTYELEDNNGQRRVYNQSHLKRRFGVINEDHDWQDAYDAAARKFVDATKSASEAVPVPATTSCTDGSGSPAGSRATNSRTATCNESVGRERYNLRSRAGVVSKYRY